MQDKQERKTEKKKLFSGQRQLMPFVSASISYIEYGKKKMKKYINEDEILMMHQHINLSWQNKYIMGTIDNINLRSKVRGRKVARGGRERELVKSEKREQDIVQFCIMGIVSEGFSKAVVIGSELLYIYKDILKKYESGNKVLAILSSKAKSAHITVCHAIIDVDDFEGMERFSSAHYLVLKNKKIKSYCKRYAGWYIMGVREHEDKNGNLMGFILATNGYKQIDFVCFSKQYGKYQKKLKVGNYVYVDYDDDEKIMNRVEYLGNYEKI